MVYCHGYLGPDERDPIEKIEVRLSVDTKNRLKKLSETYQIPMATIVRGWIEGSLDKEDMENGQVKQLLLHL